MIEPLSASELAALGDIAAVAQRLAIPLMLIGANARRFAFDLPFKLASPRATQDWDFAVPMESWEAFSRFYHNAVHSESGRFRPGNSAHQIIHGDTGIRMDLVPFGRLSEVDGKIRWPGTQHEMCVLGFEEAYESCQHESLPNGAEFGIVTPSLLAALKIIAYSDRGRSIPKDLLDLWFIMAHYTCTRAQMNRVYDEIWGLFPNESYYEHLDSLLLGWDLGRQCQGGTVAAIDVVLSSLADEESARLDVLLTRTGDLDEQQTQRRRIAGEFGWLRIGIAMGQGAGGSRSGRGGEK